MKRKIDAEELGATIEPVVKFGDEVLIEENGKIIAAIVPGDQYAELERHRDEARKRINEFVGANRAQNANVPADEVEQAVHGVVEAVRRDSRRTPPGP